MKDTESLRFICDPGMEDICAREITRKCPNIPASAQAGDTRSGMVFLAGTSDSGPWIHELRTVYFVIRHLGKISLDPELMQESLCRWAETAVIPELQTAKSFRVRAERSGIHPFSSNNINTSVGAVFDTRTSAMVSLENPDLTIRIDIRDDTAYMGIQLNQSPMDKRWQWQYRPRVTLRTTIAAGMIQSGYRHLQLPKSGLCFVDPFCGSGTILLEAVAVLPDAEIIGGDNDPQAVAGCLENAIAASCADSIDVQEWNALDLSAVLPEASVDLIVTNPPFGLRLGKKINFRKFYQQLLDSAAFVLRPGGCFVLLVGKKRGLFNYVLEESSQWRQADARLIEIGGSYPGMFTLQRL